VEFYWSPAADIDTWYAESIATGGINEQRVAMADNPAADAITITGGFSGTCIPTTTQAYGPSPWVTGQIGCLGLTSGTPSIAAESTGGLIAADAGPDPRQGATSTGWPTAAPPGTRRPCPASGPSWAESPSPARRPEPARPLAHTIILT